MKNELERYLWSFLNGAVGSTLWQGEFSQSQIDTLARNVRSIVKEEMGYENVETLFGDVQIIEDETLPPNTIILKKPRAMSLGKDRKND